MEEQFPWLIIKKYFNDNPNYLVSHNLDSYNSFFNEDIKRIFKEKNPIRIMKEQDPEHPLSYPPVYRCPMEENRNPGNVQSRNSLLITVQL